MEQLRQWTKGKKNSLPSKFQWSGVNQETTEMTATFAHVTLKPTTVKLTRIFFI